LLRTPRDYPVKGEMSMTTTGSASTGGRTDPYALDPRIVGKPTAPNVVLTPHMGAFSDDANAAMGTTVVRDIARVLRGEPRHHPVTA
jgi:hypothetical protein